MGKMPTSENHVRAAAGTAGALSPARRRLLTLLQQLNFGRVEGLDVRGGEPVLDPMPQVVREHKFGGENGPRPEAACGDFALKDQHLDLMVQLDRIGDGTITTLVVKHGLPFQADLPPARAGGRYSSIPRHSTGRAAEAMWAPDPVFPSPRAHPVPVPTPPPDGRQEAP
jgi:hypothetical protein